MYYETLEADFQRDYGLDLSDALWGEKPMSIRKVWGLIANLNPEAIFRHLMRKKDEEEKEAEAARVASAEETLQFFEQQGAINGKRIREQPE